jgi:hypothetical protein
MKITPEMLARCGTEHGHQCAVFCWANDHKETWPELESMFAIPNGGLRSKVTASRLKAEGVKSGVSDIFLPVIRRKPNFIGSNYCYHGLFIEMKIPKGGRIEPEQIIFQGLMRERGYKAEICKGWIEAVQTLQDYLQLPK